MTRRDGGRGACPVDRYQSPDEARTTIPARTARTRNRPRVASSTGGVPYASKRPSARQPIDRATSSDPRAATQKRPIRSTVRTDVGSGMVRAPGRSVGRASSRRNSTRPRGEASPRDRQAIGVVTRQLNIDGVIGPCGNVCLFTKTGPLHKGTAVLPVADFAPEWPLSVCLGSILVEEFGTARAHRRGLRAATVGRDRRAQPGRPASHATRDPPPEHQDATNHGRPARSSRNPICSRWPHGFPFQPNPTHVTRPGTPGAVRFAFPRRIRRSL